MKQKSLQIIFCLFLLGSGFCYLFFHRSSDQTWEWIDSYNTGEEVLEGFSSMNQSKEDEVSSTEPTFLKIYVHVCGEVNNPGVYELDLGARAYEAIEKAGGFTQNAEVSLLNLAQVLQDGMQLKVPTPQEQDLFSQESQMTNLFGHSQSEKMNLNLATKDMLMTLPGIGESRATAIITYREKVGKFTKIEDIMKVSGIKEAAFAKIKDYISV
ncbi:competence protein CelA [Clostridia bacterium]|nr:competence protein CelA [Clostridia bacterium]